MATKYVRTTGNDSTGDGSTTSPWATIDKGLNSLIAGDILLIGDGTYTENSSGAGYLKMRGNFASQTIINSESGRASAVTVTSSAVNTWTVRQTGVMKNLLIKNLTFTAFPGALECWQPDAQYTLSNYEFQDCIFNADTTLGGGSYAIILASSASTTNSSGAYTRCAFNNANSGGASTAAFGYISGTLDTFHLTLTNCTCQSATKGIWVDGPFMFLSGDGGQFNGTGNQKVTVELGRDSPPGGGLTVTWKNTICRSTQSHALELADACKNSLVVGNRVYGGDWALVIKDANNSIIKDNVVTAGTLGACILKGGQRNIVRDNIFIATISGTYAFTNLDQNSSPFIVTNSTVLNNRVIATGGAHGVRWSALTDGGGNTVDSFIYDVTGTGNMAVLLGSNLNSLAAIRSGWLNNASSSGAAEILNEASSILAVNANPILPSKNVTLTFGPFVSSPDLLSNTRAVSGVVVDLFPPNVDYTFIPTGYSLYTGASDVTGKATVNFNAATDSTMWIMRVTYPVGSFDTLLPASIRQYTAPLFPQHN